MGKPHSPDMATESFLCDICETLNRDDEKAKPVEFIGSDSFPSAFAVSDLAAASVAAASLSVADYMEAGTGTRPDVHVDRRLASLWFGNSIRPIGWQAPPLFDPVFGDYRGADGWIKLHTNAPHHRQAALDVIGAPAERPAMAEAIAGWKVSELEAAIVAKGGASAAMRDRAAWADHAQGKAVQGEPLVWQSWTETTPRGSGDIDPARPLKGIRVLDLTRVLAGPVATRFLAGYGAEVLRIDPPWWEEPGAVTEVVLGKRCARLDLRVEADLIRLKELLAEADVLVHGYRPGALEGLGLGAEARRKIAPNLIDVSLCAYGWTGPWSQRRGFDSLVQMSSGVAEAGMRHYGTDKPKPLPVQALDHATGYLMAAAVLRGLAERRKSSRSLTARTSLARTAALLVSAASGSDSGSLKEAEERDFSPVEELTAWGPALRLRPPAVVEGCPMVWDIPSCALGSSEAEWQ
ncbi:MAG: CoA transferase [Pseudomonadota bacterium]